VHRAGRLVGTLLALAVLTATLLLSGADDREGSDPGGENESRGIVPGGSAAAKVQRVVDGDTIEVQVAGAVETVRLIGVDTPETVKPGSPVECFGPQASAFTKGRLDGETLRLRFDRELRDRYGRLLAYAYAGGRLFNAELIEHGLARTLEIEPNTSRAKRLERSQARASRAGRGLWGHC
jgi:micrococcal nuclease